MASLPGPRGPHAPCLAKFCCNNLLTLILKYLFNEKAGAAGSKLASGSLGKHFWAAKYKWANTRAAGIALAFLGGGT